MRGLLSTAALSMAALSMAGLAAGFLLGCTGSQHSGGVYIRDLTIFQGGAPGMPGVVGPAPVSATAPVVLDPHDDHPVFLRAPVSLTFDTSNAGGNARGADTVSPSTTATATGSLPGAGG